MKKLLFLCATALFALQAMAIPAIKKPAHLINPNSDLNVRLNGDEFFNFYTTQDGYTVLRNVQGGWDYAVSQNGRLVSTGITAHNAGKRSATEIQMLSGLNKNAVDEAKYAQGQQLRDQLRQEVQRRARFNLNRFRGLIVLVEYTDMQFQMSNPQEFYNHMVNDHNYTGFTLNGKKVQCPGSVRDYYYDQSDGKFDPQFDVVGPVRVNYSAWDHHQASSSPSIFISALKAVDSQVDFTKYDGDDDGVIDLVFFIGAGPSSCYEGNDENLLWPHKYSFYLQTLLTRLDGKRPYDYACCTEIYGWQDTPSSLETQGIGVMCHEFSHVLGLMDHYDADGTSSGGLSRTLGQWDIMDDGAANDAARTPSAYTLFERWSLGWCNPPVINQKGIYTLNAIDGTSEGYILRSPDSNEYFTLENRQKTTKWDKFLPGHGMLLIRVDSASTTAWTGNKVNTNPSHNYIELRRAWNNTSDEDLPSDPFPGTKTVTKITNATSPNLVTWSGKKNAYNILGIREAGGKITFEVVGDGEQSNAKKLVETFEKLPLGLATGTEAQGDIAKWKLNGAATIASYNSSRQVQLTLPSTMETTTPLYYAATSIEATVTNPGSTAKFTLHYSIDGGNTWTPLASADGSTTIQVAGGQSVTATWDVNFDNTMPVLYRITMNGGTKNSPCYVDNFTIFYDGEPGEPEVSDKKLLETFEKLPTNLTNGGQAQGDIATWTIGNATITNYNNSRQVSMTLPSTLRTTTPLYYNVIQVAAYITNPQTSAAKFSLYNSVDNGATWNVIKTPQDETILTVDPETTVKAIWNVDFNNNMPVLYRLDMVGTAKNMPCYIDNFTLYYNGEPGPGFITGDVNGDGKVDVEDVNAVINIILEQKTAEDFNGEPDINGDGKVDVEDVNAIINIILTA
ncbi:MAG: M6 family metalloprotease domain-containing protein [Muribaculaceae bacterium]|nr:M6 family metalloprotease domain-containing protein [Muribaculaceae bacterium]